MDAIVVAVAGCDRLHVFHHPCRVSHGTVGRQWSGFIISAPHPAAAIGTGGLPDSDFRQHCRDGIYANPVATVLARGPMVVAESMVQLRSGCLPLYPDGFSFSVPMGCELPPGVGRCGGGRR